MQAATSLGKAGQSHCTGAFPCLRKKPHVHRVQRWHGAQSACKHLPVGSHAGLSSPRQPASEQNAAGSAGCVSGSPPAGPVWTRHRGFPARSLASLLPCALGPAAPGWRVLTRTTLCSLTLSFPDCPHPSRATGTRASVFLPVLRTSVTEFISSVPHWVGARGRVRRVTSACPCVFLPAGKRRLPLGGVERADRQHEVWGPQDGAGPGQAGL